MALFVAVAAQIQNQSSHRTCRIHAIAEHGIPVRIALDDLILTESLQEVGKGLLGNIFRDDRLAERHKDRMRWFPFVTCIQLALPPIEQFQRAGRVANFVTKIIRPAAIRVDIVEILVQRFGEKPGYDVEVFVVMRCQPPRFGACRVMSISPGSNITREIPRSAKPSRTQNTRLARSRGTIRDAGTANDRWVWFAPENYGRTANLISPLRDFMRANACGSSASRISSVTKSRAEISPRRMASRASRKNRGV